MESAFHRNALQRRSARRLARYLVGRLCQTPFPNLFIVGKTFLVTATVSNASPVQRGLDSLEYNSIFRELIRKFGEGDQNRLTAIAIFRVGHMIH